MQEHLELYDKLGFCVIPITFPEKNSERNDGKKPYLQEWMPYMTRRSIRSEWEKWWPPEEEKLLNIGIITGKVSDIAVLDFDDEESYRQVARISPAIEDTYTVQTGKGYHVYFRPDVHTRTTTFRMNGKLHHVKQEGGYIVAPPSVHKTGRKYDIYNPAEPKAFNVKSVVELLNEAGAEAETRTYKERPATWASDLCDIVPDGERNTRAAQLCGLLIRKFPYDIGLVSGLMEAWNDKYCKPPMSEREIRQVVDGEFRRYGPKG